LNKNIFLNGKIILETEGHVSLKDRGFLYGDGIFETLRSYNGTPFKLTEHLERLRSSAGKLKIPLKYTIDELSNYIDGLIAINGIPDVYIRITLSRGIGNNGLAISEQPNPTLLIQSKPFTPYQEELYEKGMDLIISNARRSTSCPISCHKTINLLTSILLKEETRRKSASEAIILNTDGYVAECVISNIFIVNGKNVVTPPLDTNILPGITRKTVLDICRDKGITAKEERFKIDALTSADEIFITNSLMEIMPVRKVEDKICKSVPGEITSQIRDAYKCLTKLLR
jgi:branched-chain amino acid aminotransferase